IVPRSSPEGFADPLQPLALAPTHLPDSAGAVIVLPKPPPAEGERKGRVRPVKPAPGTARVVRSGRGATRTGQPASGTSGHRRPAPGGGRTRPARPRSRRRS